MWHRRLGHPSREVLLYLPHSLGVKCDLNKDKEDSCEIFFRAKQTRNQFYISNSHAKDAFDLIHCDIWGPYRTPSLCGAHYFLSIVDDTSRATWVYLMKDKSEASKLLKGFIAMVRNQFHKGVKVVRSDNGSEFTSGPMQHFYCENGILRENSCADTPQQNGRVERKHRHILNMARALRFQANLPIQFWGECVLTAAYLTNRTPSKLLKGKSPYEILFDCKPSYSEMRIFGTLCFARHSPRAKDKFASRSKRCVFLGYPFGKKGWKVYDLETQEIFVSREVKFCEDKYPFEEATPHSDREMDGETGWKQTNIFDEFGPCDPPVETSEPVRTGVQEGPGQFNPTDSPGSRQPGEQEDRGSSVLGLTGLQEDGPGRIGREAAHSERLSTDPTDTSNAEHGPPPPQPTADSGSNTLRSSRSRRPPTHLDDYVCYNTRSRDPLSLAHQLQKDSSGTPYPIANYVTSANFSVTYHNFLATIMKVTKPRYYHEAVKDSRWRVVMEEEIRALEKNQTWILQDLPHGKKHISCKWVYRVKYNSDGSIQRFKARLVIRGDHQLEGFDYNETFAPVAKMTTVRCFLAVAVSKGWDLHQLDVNNAFLHGDLDEEVYMMLPPGFTCSTPHKVCRLQKSLYGLRQAPRQWFAKLSSKLREYGFIHSYADYSLFTYRKENVFMALLVYVDDIVLASNDHHACNEFKSYLHSCFSIKDLGPLKYFLGIEVAR